jgi:hypothetical protein
MSDTLMLGSYVTSTRPHTRSPRPDLLKDQQQSPLPSFKGCLLATAAFLARSGLTTISRAAES